ncbi:MAG TPA: hypothetical protein VGO22_05705 [Pseudorhizobium sp.]|nr:hypothetical protein [Pseudorhizobium sp.]
MMLEKLKRLLGADTNSSAAIETALAEIDLEDLREAQSRIGSERQAMLLSGTNEQILEAERRLDGARLDLERATLAHDALTTRLQDAKAREAEETIRANHASATAARSSYITKLERELPRIAKTLEALFEEGNAIHLQVKNANKPLYEGNEELGLSVLTSPSYRLGETGKLAEIPDWLLGLLNRHLARW